jgi:hypothetical protein
MSATPLTEAGAFDAEWLLQPQGEARRLEAALSSFEHRGFDGPRYTAVSTEVEGCPAYGLVIISQAGEWSPREWEVLGRLTVAGLYPGERVYETAGQRFRGGPSIWTRGRTGESVFEGGDRLRDRLELPLLRHLAVLGIRTGDATWLPPRWEFISEDDTLRETDAEGAVVSEWQFTDDEYGVGSVRRVWAADPSEPERHALLYIGYHVAGRLAGIKDPHAVYAQRQREFEAELSEAQIVDAEVGAS